MQLIYNHIQWSKIVIRALDFADLNNIILIIATHLINNVHIIMFVFRFVDTAILLQSFKVFL